MRIAVAALALAPLTLTACGDAPDTAETTAAPTPTPTVAAPRTLVAADFSEDMFGAKIVGPQGPEPEAALMSDGREIGRIVSFVACPPETSECKPSAMPEGTVYTYVHKVTLAADVEPAAAEESVEGAPPEIPASLFRSTRRATGFNGSIGYSKAQAETALGAPDAMTVSSDQGQLIWRATEGGGWKPGSTITFFWQSTVPPGGPADVWQVEAQGLTASATGPFPPAAQSAGN